MQVNQPGCSSLRRPWDGVILGGSAGRKYKNCLKALFII
ncbi:hypothetical protein C4K00_3320 [Pseudomonas synxantha]|nr:hypothetical protein C4K00_3320 [Pseudomonas synxantha]AZE79143.1 hypothetical protein C4J99_3360 [Pseudomonas synxantha]